LALQVQAPRSLIQNFRGTSQGRGAAGTASSATLWAGKASSDSGDLPGPLLHWAKYPSRSPNSQRLAGLLCLAWKNNCSAEVLDRHSVAVSPCLKVRISCRECFGALSLAAISSLLVLVSGSACRAIFTPSTLAAYYCTPYLHRIEAYLLPTWTLGGLSHSVRSLRLQVSGLFSCVTSRACTVRVTSHLNATAAWNRSDTIYSFWVTSLICASCPGDET
jgi:hypothetical protein